MKKTNLVACAVALVLAAACVPSVHPFFTDKDVLFNPQLLGEWSEADKADGEKWVFQKEGDNAYKLLITEEGGKSGEFKAHLFKLQDHLFLDLIATTVRLQTNEADLVSASLIPGHLLMRVLNTQPALEIAAMNPDWLQKYLHSHPDALPHAESQDRVFLTATTKQLQAFVLQHLAKDELFGDPGKLQKLGEKK